MNRLWPLILFFFGLNLCAITEEEEAFFEAYGYLGPVTCLSVQEAEALGQELTTSLFKQMLHKKVTAQRRNSTAVYWSKNFLFLVPQVVEIGTCEALLSYVHPFLGPDLTLWGVELVEKRPQVHHRWHVDIEHTGWDGLTIWLPLSNVSCESTISFIPGSQKYGSIPQTFEKNIDLQKDAEVLQVARRIDPKAQMVSMEMKPGQFVLFAGRMWHRSINKTDKTRQALIFQYCRADAEVQIPLNYAIPTNWDLKRPRVLHLTGVEGEYSYFLDDFGELEPCASETNLAVLGLLRRVAQNALLASRFGE